MPAQSTSTCGTVRLHTCVPTEHIRKGTITHVLTHSFTGVTRSMIGAVIVIGGWLSWVIYFQVNWRDWPWALDIMMVIPEQDISGW